MRLRVMFELSREALIPLNHQYALSSLTYGLLKSSSPEYARFLHEDGYQLEGDSQGRHFKLFTFSGLRVPANRRRVEGDCLRVRPGIIEWLVSSPRDDFLLHSATGLLAAGHTLKICHVELTITEVSALPEPEFSLSPMRFTCLTPIVASVPRPEGKTYYLRPSDGEEFSEAVRANLIRKFRLLNEDKMPTDESFSLEFDSEYLADPKHRGGTKKISIKEIDIVGAFCPFEVTGSPELIRVGYQAGFGEKNSVGFGMVEIVGGR